MSLTDSFYSGVAPDRDLADILGGPAADALGGRTHLDFNVSVSAARYRFDVGDVIVVVGGNLFAGAPGIGAWDY